MKKTEINTNFYKQVFFEKEKKRQENLFLN